MRSSTRMVAGAVLAAGLGLSGCGGDDEVDVNEGGVPAVFEDEEVGSPDPVDGGEEDADGVDRGTGGIDQDDNTVLDDGTEDQAAGGSDEDENTRLQDNTEDQGAGSADGGSGGDGTGDVG
ncbi:hypothetical protein [Blastococcus sp. SYSU DS0973]